MSARHDSTGLCDLRHTSDLAVTKRRIRAHSTKSRPLGTTQSSLGRETDSIVTVGKGGKELDIFHVQTRSIEAITLTY